MFGLSLEQIRDKLFSMMQQTSESTASFVIPIEQKRMYQGVDVISIYHAFVSKLDNNMQALLDNVQVNKRANGSSGLMWSDVVAICRD